MKFKMRILHFSPDGNAEKIADAIARDQKINCDRIPPAYPIENEKLVFIGLDAKGSSADKTVKELCNNMNTSRTKNVAFYAVGSGNFALINELKEIVRSKGIEIAGETLECTVKGGLFKKGSVSEGDVQNAVAWAGKIVDSLA